MSATATPPHRRRFAVLLGLSLLAGFVSGFLPGMPGLAPLIVVPVGVVCVFLAGFAMLKLRPKSTGLLAAPLAVMVVTGLTVVGGHSLWLTTFGDQVSGCEVISVNKHTSSRSPTSFSNDVMFGSQKVPSHFPPSQDELRKPGDRVDLVIDRTGVVRVLEPSELTWGRNVLVPVAAAVGVAFVLVVLQRRRWKPGKPAAPRNLDKNFL